MARAPKQQPPKWREAYDESAPLPPCPFTGKQLTLRVTKDQHGTDLFAASGEFFFTRFFPTKRQLVYWLSHRDGEAPGFNASAVSSVTERTEPAPNAFQDVIDKDKKIDEIAKEVVSRHAKDLKG
jgi:hypothetical protein